MSATTFVTVGNVALAAIAVAAANGTYNVFLVNVISSQILSVLGTHFGYVYKLQFSPCGCLLASCGSDGVIQLFKISGFTFYGFHFWSDLEYNKISQAKADLEV